MSSPIRFAQAAPPRFAANNFYTDQNKDLAYRIQPLQDATELDISGVGPSYCTVGIPESGAPFHFQQTKDGYILKRQGKHRYTIAISRDQDSARIALGNNSLPQQLGAKELEAAKTFLNRILGQLAKIQQG